MALMVITNHAERQFVYRQDVPQRVLDLEFDYQDPEDTVDGFFEYRGVWYHLDMFMRDVPQELAELGYNGWVADSFFSGVAIKLSEDGETFQVATAYSAPSDVSTTGPTRGI
jgi:hypothetical protein